MAHMQNENKEAQDDSFALNVPDKALAKAKNALIKWWPYFFIIIPILIVIIVRSQTIELTLLDEYAQTNVYNYYRSQIEGQIKQQYPNLPQENLQGLADEQLNNFLKSNKAQIEQQILGSAKQSKDFYQYESGSHSYPYMGDIDSYYWLRQARNIVEKGYNCDVVENRVCYDTYTLAPLKLRLGKTFHPYSIAVFYKILRAFNPDMTMMQGQILMATFYAVIVAILVYIMMLKLFGPLAALTSSTLISVSQIFLTRTLGGDNDNLIFPILVIFLAFEAFTANGWKKKAVFAALAGLAVGAYSFAWVGWWYLFDFIVIAVLVEYLAYFIKTCYHNKRLVVREFMRNEKTKSMIALLAPFVLFSVLSVGLISDFSALNNALFGPLGFTKIKVAANISTWPNVLTTVAEFNVASLSEVVNSAGGKWFFFFALLGFFLVICNSLKRIRQHWLMFFSSVAILYYLVTPSALQLQPVTYVLIFAVPILIGMYIIFRSEEEVDIKLAVLLFLWTASSIYAATKGVRFIFLLAPPIAVGIGIAFGTIHRILSRLIAKITRIPKSVVAIALFVVFSAYLINPVEAGIGTAKNYFPSVNDQWWNALTEIKSNSAEDAIINSWWDFGHWFKYIADRRVTLDGSSQNNPQLHWLGKLLLTSNEKEAVGILRMLDCGGNKAFNEIDKRKNSAPKSIALLNRILLIKSREEAKGILVQEGFLDKDAESVLEYSHCEPPENFLIASEDMVGKSGVWAHFGSWNFERAWMQRIYASQRSKDKVTALYIKELNLSKQQADDYYSQIASLKSDSEINAWIAPWPSYMQGETDCSAQDGFVVCPVQQIAVFINTTTMDAFIPTNEGIRRPNVFAYTTPKTIEVKKYESDTIGIGMVLMPLNNAGYKAIFMQPQLVNSTFTKLFYLDGHGMSRFDLFHSSGSNFRIKVWKVNWEGNEKPIAVERFASQESNVKTRPDN